MIVKSSVRGRATSFVILAVSLSMGSTTYQGVQEHVKAGSGIDLGKLHHCVKLQRSNLKSGARIPLTVGVGKLLEEVMLLLRHF